MSSNRSNGRANRNWIARCAALLGLAPGLGGQPGLRVTQAAAEPALYRSAAEVPPSWRDFAHQLQSRFVERLASNTKTVGKLARDMARRHGGSDAPTGIVTVRAWISPGGKVTRLEFDGLDRTVAADLRALLSKGEVGAPPADMLQPVSLRLALRPKEQAN